MTKLSLTWSRGWSFLLWHCINGASNQTNLTMVGEARELIHGGARLWISDVYYIHFLCKYIRWLFCGCELFWQFNFLNLAGNFIAFNKPVISAIGWSKCREGSSLIIFSCVTWCTDTIYSFRFFKKRKTELLGQVLFTRGKRPKEISVNNLKYYLRSI